MAGVCQPLVFYKELLILFLGFSFPNWGNFADLNEVLAISGNFPFIPETPTVGRMDMGIGARPITPLFSNRKDYAVDAATTLKQLQQQIEKEQKEAQAVRLRKELEE